MCRNWEAGLADLTGRSLSSVKRGDLSRERESAARLAEGKSPITWDSSPVPDSKVFSVFQEAYKLIVRQDLVSQCEQMNNKTGKLKVWGSNRRCSSGIVNSSENCTPSSTSALATTPIGIASRHTGVQDVCYCLCHTFGEEHDDGMECLNCEVFHSPPQRGSAKRQLCCR